jgi:glucosamine-6-phosphate deaminase
MSSRELRFGAGEVGIPGVVFPDADALGEALARETLEETETALEGGRTYLLGCPAGRSLRSTHSALADLVDRFASPAA